MSKRSEDCFILLYQFFGLYYLERFLSVFSRGTNLSNSDPPALNASLQELSPDCWICKSLREPSHLVFFESKTSIGKLNPDQFFKGYSFVTLKWHDEELYKLSDKNRRSFLEDMSRVATALAKTFNPDKMNYELLGNGMPHLHWHLVPRYKTDPMWGRPIWTGSKRRKRLTREEYEGLVKQLQSHLKEHN